MIVNRLDCFLCTFYDSEGSFFPHFLNFALETIMEVSRLASPIASILLR